MGPTYLINLTARVGLSTPTSVNLMEASKMARNMEKASKSTATAIPTTANSSMGYLTAKTENSLQKTVTAMWVSSSRGTSMVPGRLCTQMAVRMSGNSGGI